MDFEGIEKAAREVEPLLSVAANSMIIGGVIGSGFTRLLRRSRIFLSAMIGVLAGAATLGAYLLAPALSPSTFLVAATILSAASVGAIFIMLALTPRPGSRLN